MRRFLVIALPIATIVIFILIMLSGNSLKKPLGKNDNIPESINLIITDVESDKWEDANDKTVQLEKTWKKIVTRVQFSSERDEINAFSMNIARLRGIILARDKAGCLAELYEAYEHWDELGK